MNTYFCRLCRLVAALMLLATLAGCGPIKQETAMEWLQRQPHIMDP